MKSGTALLPKGKLSAGDFELMASSKEYLDFVLEQLSELDEITYRAMMGEYIIYFRGKIAGGIYDDRFLVKNIPELKEYEFKEQIPYPGGRAMLLVDIENPSEIKEIVSIIYNALKK